MLKLWDFICPVHGIFEAWAERPLDAFCPQCGLISKRRIGFKGINLPFTDEGFPRASRVWEDQHDWLLDNLKKFHVTQPETSIPETYRGKSAEELIKMHQNLEKKFKERDAELGELRTFAQNQVAKPPETSEVDFFDDPEGAVRRIIQQELAPTTAQFRQQQETAMRERLNASYPKWEETAKSEDFQNWVAASKVRTDLFLKANDLDWSAADELFSTWSQLSEKSEAREKASKEAVERDRKIRAATTERGSAGIDPRKILSRQDLRELRRTNPTRYNELLPDIRKAYAEGRAR